MRGPRDMEDLTHNVGGVFGAQLKTPVQKIDMSERKKFNAMNRTNPAVLKATHEQIYAEEAPYANKRVEHVHHMKKVKEGLQSKAALKKAKQNVKRLKQRQNMLNNVVASITETKAWSMVSLGQGLKNGGYKLHQKNRFKVMDRVRQVISIPHPAPGNLLAEFQRVVGCQEGRGEWDGMGGSFCPRSGTHPTGVVQRGHRGIVQVHGS